MYYYYIILKLKLHIFKQTNPLRHILKSSLAEPTAKMGKFTAGIAYFIQLLFVHFLLTFSMH